MGKAPSGTDQVVDEGSRSVRRHGVLMVAAVLVPGLLFVGAAWQNRQDVLQAGGDSIERTVAVMQEHARKVFEAAELAIGVVDERTNDMDWPAIESARTHDFLRRLKTPIDQVVAIWIADRTGALRAGSIVPGSGASIVDRTFFQRQREADRGIEISRPFRGSTAGVLAFAVARRRTVMEGGVEVRPGVFDGTIHVSVDPEYFARFYLTAAPPLPHTATLMRADGAVLARERGGPDALQDGGLSGLRMASPDDAYAPDSPLMQRIGRTPEGTLVQDVMPDGQIRDYAFRRVGSYPAYVVFSVRHSVLLGRWYRNLVVFGLVAAAAAATLSWVSWLALRGARAEQAALALLRDEVRQRMAAEQQLAHAQRMEAVGQLTGGVAHDFNNLLTAILGNLELMQRTAVGMGAAGAAGVQTGVARIERLAATAIKAVQRGAALTRSLLAFSRNQPLQPRPLDASALLAEFIDLVRQAMGAAIDVSLEAGATVPACVADPAALEAAILNLAINARDAMPEGGWLRLQTGAAWLDAAALDGNAEARPGHFVSIEVSDGGCGMEAAVATRAFEPFFTTKPIGQGTGLGLSQVYGFVRQLGGHVTLVSAPGQGTSITLFLPVAEKAAA